MVSRDVRFEENIFPFHKDSMQAYMQPTLVCIKPKTFFDDSYIESLATDVSDSQRVTTSVQELVHCSPPVPVPSSPRRSARYTKRPTWMTDYVTTAASSDTASKLVYPVANQVSYAHLAPTHQAFLTARDQQANPASFEVAVQSQKWCDAMNTELQALEKNST